MKTWQEEDYKLQFEVIPGILEPSWGGIERRIKTIKPFMQAIHIDLLDGKFVDNTTFLNPKPFKKYSEDIFFELHMMVDNPLQYLKPFADAGFKRFLGHVEKMPDIAEFVAEGQLLGEVGLAIDKDTKPEDLKINYDDLDVLLIMTIKAGFSGLRFLPELLEKVKKIRSDYPELPIEVDGGINEETILQAKQAGASRFITTSALSTAKDPQGEYQTLCGLIA